MRNAHLNAVTRDAVEAELSDAEMYRLAYLTYRVTSPEIPTVKGFIEAVRIELLSGMRFRSAPSIVVRSEAELFGINMPRFAYRAIIAEGTEQASFVNLRRIESFVSNVARRLEMGPRDEFISQLRQKCRCVADSFLAVPQWAADYHVITTDLAQWYSEKGPATGTPFVTHFPVGGGMCAQAVCFMVSALLHRYATGVYGVSEVTMLSTPGNDSDQKFLNFSGLTIDRMKTYFRKIGLHAQPQYTNNLAYYRSAIRAYLMSGIPVIIPVDISKLRKTIYKQLPLSSQHSRANETEIERHVVLAVGVRKDGRNDGAEEFLIHDPATYPYIRATAEQLFEAGKGLGSNDDWASIFPVSTEQIPVLLSLSSTGHDINNRGLLLTSDRARQQPKHSRRPCSWCQTSELVNGARHQLFPNEGEWEKLIECLSAYELRNSWLQVPEQFSANATVTAWLTAENELFALEFRWNDSRQCWEPGKQDLADSFRAAPKASTENVSETTNSGQAIADECQNITIPSEDPTLKASMMTSFTLSGAADVARTLTAIDWNGPLEQYVWMQRDVDKVIETHVGKSLTHRPVRDMLKLNAVDALALLSPGRLLMDSIVNFYTALTQPTVAIATFIPELSADPESERAELARLAIVTLGWLAICINQSQAKIHAEVEHPKPRPPVKRIELVGGSRIGRVYQCMPPGRSRIELIAEVLSSGVALRHMADNLRLALESDNHLVERMRESHLAFALEQEPGPLFVLGSMNSLQEFCKSFLDEPQYRLLRKVVGLNADVSHWTMSAEGQQQFEAVRHRIVHAHISGHHPTSHFGDTDLTDAMAARYQSLLQLLQSLLSEREVEWRQKNELPQYSGYISLEYEAAPDLESVRKSIDCLQLMLKAPAQGSSRP